MNLQRRFKRYQQKYYAPGSPLRYVRKALFALSNPQATATRARLGAAVTEHLSADAETRVAALNTTGYAEAGPEIDRALLAELDQVSIERLQKGADQGTKIRSFFTSLTQPDDLRTESIFVRFALQPAVQQLVCAYFDRKVPYLADLTLLLSHGTGSEKWEESQLWHRDYADNKTVKLWVYLTDVESVAKGAFTYLPLTASRRVKNRFFPGRVSDAQMQEQGLASAAQEVAGPRLKTFYIDTSRCYHLGSRMNLGEIRLAYVATFISHAPLYPFDNRIKTNGHLPEVEKLLLTL